MGLAPGMRIGPYEVIAPIGAGGMGEVYRARDTRLDRDVAIKILPAAFAADAERLARFEREAKTLAALNHPNIAHIYAIETLAEPTGKNQPGRVSALVMELVDGEDLSRRIARGALPLAEALAIARQIAGALEAAHEKGIVHRDLKPANVMLSADGEVKVLDFGLARTGDAAPGGSSGDLMNSPTITSPATQLGMILGTAAYMSPEQAKGRPADRRSDVWALGCVLFEMLTARRAFEGDDLSDTLAAVLRGDPDWSAVPASTPPHVAVVIRQCLARDRKARIPDASVVRFLLDAGSIAGVHAAGVARAPRRRRRAAALVAAGALAGTAIVAAIGWPLTKRAEQPRIQFAFDAPESPSSGSLASMAVSPDGRFLAFAQTRGGGTANLVFVRALDALDVKPLEGTEGVSGIFWSPDSRFLGFIARGKLKKIPIAGGPAHELADASGTGINGAWGADGDIVFSSGALAGASLYRVHEAGGAVTELLKPDAGQQHTAYRSPMFVPGSRHFLFLAWSADPARRGIFAGSLDGGAPVMVVQAESQPILAPGFLLYHRNGAVFAQTFDERRLRVSGEPTLVAEDVRFNNLNGRAAFSASRTGVLAMLTGQSRETDRALAWMDRAGRPLGTVGEPGAYSQIRLSPDEKRVVVAVPDPRTSLMTLSVMDLATRISTPMPLESGGNDPLWSPDSTTVMFEAIRQAKRDFFTQVVGSRGATLIFESPDDPKWLDDWSHDGRYVLFHRPQPARLFVIEMSPASGPRVPRLLVEHAGVIDSVHFSPDDKWVAYVSDESGEAEVWVAAFPAFDQRRRVSVRGGGQPWWRADGRELFYLAPDGRMMSALVSPAGAAGSIELQTPRVLFQSPIDVPVPTLDQYAVTRDGQRFLFIQPGVSRQAAPPRLRVVVNWTSGIAQ